MIINQNNENVVNIDCVIKQIKAGDKTLYNNLIIHYMPTVEKIANEYNINMEKEDVYQVGYNEIVDVFNSIMNGEAKSAFSNLLVASLHRLYKRLEKNTAVDFYQENILLEQNNTYEIDEFEFEDLKQYYNKLSDNQKENVKLFFLCKYHGYSQIEVAKKLNVSRNLINENFRRGFLILCNFYLKNRNNILKEEYKKIYEKKLQNNSYYKQIIKIKIK